MDTVAKAKAALAGYKNTGMVAVPLNMPSNDYGVWRACFRDFPEAWKSIARAEIMTASRESFDGFQEHLQQGGQAGPYLAVTVMLANATIQNYEPDAVPASHRAIFEDIQTVAIGIWLGQFDSVKDVFVPLLAAQISRYGGGSNAEKLMKEVVSKKISENR